MRVLKQKAHDTGLPLKEVLNRALRVGIQDMDKRKRFKPYRCKTYSLGYPPKADINRALDLAEHLESEEISRKLLLRK